MHHGDLLIGKRFNLHTPMTHLLATLVLTGLVLLSPSLAHTQTAADSAAVRHAALDYIEGWYTGNAARMERALHPELVKRIVGQNRATGAPRIGNMTAAELVRDTGSGAGRNLPPSQQRKDVTILTMDGNMASVKLVSARLIDYMHLVRWNGEWKILNVLWDFQARSRS